MNRNTPLSLSWRSSQPLCLTSGLNGAFSLRFSKLARRSKNEKNCSNSFHIAHPNRPSKSRHPWKDRAHKTAKLTVNLSLAHATGRKRGGFTLSLRERAGAREASVLKLIAFTAVNCVAHYRWPSTLEKLCDTPAKYSDINAFRHLSFGATRRYKSSRDKAAGGPKQPAGKNRIRAPKNGVSGGRDAAD